MTHQIDFHITLWSDDEQSLLTLEKALNEINTMRLAHPRWGETEHTDYELKMGVLVELLAGFERLNRNKNFKVDVHSVDINWDEDWELEGDPAKIERLKKLLHHADAQDDYSQILWLDDEGNKRVLAENNFRFLYEGNFEKGDDHDNRRT